VENRGLVFACDPDASRRVIDGVRKTIGGELPIIAKLSPDVTDLPAIARGVVDAGADGLALINTVLGMVINLDTMRPHLGGKTGGLSGPAIRPVAVRAIYQVHAALPHIPILGMGGVASGRDALELILAGASGVSVGTASFGDPTALIKIQNELRDLLAARGFATLQQAIGYAHREENR
jgi:dihydroorotate dehydrogenase (NAD+) catalytic subunit